MGTRKEVFISATSADLGSYRQVAKEAVLTLGAHPIEEKNFPTDHLELQALLARRFDPCDAIIHLVGFYYGGEPKAPPDTPRRSWRRPAWPPASAGNRTRAIRSRLGRLRAGGQHLGFDRLAGLAGGGRLRRRGARARHGARPCTKANARHKCSRR
jgi:hypothetical protein